MVLNPAGYQIVFDGGNPRTITGVANEAISGGQLVYASGTSNAVSSGVNSFGDGDIKFVTGASGVEFTGVAVNQVASGARVTVATRGAHIITAAGTIVAGTTVIANGGDAVAQATTAGTVIGRALTPAGSEGYAIIDINP